MVIRNGCFFTKTEAKLLDIIEPEKSREFVLNYIARLKKLARWTYHDVLKYIEDLVDGDDIELVNDFFLKLKQIMRKGGWI